MRLALVELRRFRARRAIALTLLLAVAAVVLLAAATVWSTRSATEAEVAAAAAQVVVLPVADDDVVPVRALDVLDARQLVTFGAPAAGGLQAFRVAVGQRYQRRLVEEERVAAGAAIDPVPTRGRDRAGRRCRGRIARRCRHYPGSGPGRTCLRACCPCRRL